MNPVAALLFFITIVNLFLGVLVFFRNQKSPLHVSLSRFIFLVAGWTFSMSMFYQVSSIAYSFFWIRWTYVFGTVIANTLIYFSLVFPKGTAISLKQRFLIYAPALPMIFAILFVPQFLFKEIIINDWWKDVRLGKWEYTIYTIYFITVYFGAILVLFKKYFAYLGKLKLQVAYVLWAVFIAGSFGAIFDLLYPWINLYKFIWFGPIGTLIMVGIFVYAIVKHRFLDIRLIVARVVAYSILVGILGIAYALGVFGIGAFLIGDSSSVSQLVTSTILALIMALSFQPLRRYLEVLTDKFFFKDHYISEELLKYLSQAMNTTIDLNKLTSILLDSITKQMKVTGGAFILFAHNKKTIEYVEFLGYEQKPSFKEEEIEILSGNGRILIFDDLEEGVAKDLMRSLNAVVFIPLIVNEEKIGALLLKEKASGDIYSQQDIKVLEILAPQLSIAIQNSREYEEIKRFNITLTEEVRKATADLQKANVKLQELDRLKDDFVSIASHELRTPMTAIRSYVWMALHRSDIPLSQKMERYLYRTLLSTERLINLVNDMLNVSRIESGRIEIDPKPFDIVALVKDVMEEVKTKADEKQLHLTVLEHKMPQVFADVDKVHQVLLNLIGNSLKFCNPGGNIMVDFFTDGKMIEVSVKDDGAGISKYDLSKLFKKFGRLDNSYVAVSSSGGTGLGLYISKSLVELMHGKIWVNSEGEGKGTTFTFSLPIATQDVLRNSSKFQVKAKGEVKGLEPVAI